MRFPKKAPIDPGIYMFSDKKGRILYVGKAKNIRNRLRSYFSKTPKEPKIHRMLQEACGVKWTTTDSEIEALILESQLIKKHKTMYNVAMRDGKNFTSVAVTQEDFPIIYTTHQLPKSIKLNRGTRKVKYYGPFTEGRAIQATLKLLQRIFPYCTCRQKHNRHCLNFHIGKCLGYCCLKTTKIDLDDVKEYKKNIKSITDILSGKRRSLVKSLKKEMKMISKAGKLEEAIELRNQIEKLQRVFENAKVLKEITGRDMALIMLRDIFDLKTVPYRIEGYDISNVLGTSATGSMVVFENGQEAKNEYRKFKIMSVAGPNDTAMLQEVMTRRFQRNDWASPDLLLIDGGKGQINYAKQAVENVLGPTKMPPLISIAKGRREIFSTTKSKPIPLLKLPEIVRNLLVHIDSEAHRFAISYYRKLHRKKLK